MDLQVELPAASYARTVTTLVPTSNGACTDQLAAPDASPEEPVEVDHFTAVTPTLSLAVPLREIAGDDVETIVEPGETMRSAGGVVSAPLGGFGGAGAGGADGGAGWAGGLGWGVGGGGAAPLGGFGGAGAGGADGVAGWTGVLG